MLPVRILTPSTGPQLLIGGRRCHHGAAGCVIAAAGLATRSPLLVAAGLALAIHDRADWREWFA